MMSGATLPTVETSNAQSTFLERIFSFRVAVGTALTILIGVRARFDVVDPDVWWHLRNAKYLVTNHKLPTTDTFAYTTSGMPWINHSWLSELFYYGSFHLFGLNGVVGLSTLAIVALLTGIYAICLKETVNPIYAGLATLLGTLMATVGFGPRTQHFGWLCFVGIYAILIRFRNTRRAPLWMIPALFTLWINLHGGWLFGLAFMALFMVAGIVGKDLGRLHADQWNEAEAKQLGVTFITSCVALLFNPFGYRLVWYPFDMMTKQKLNVGNVVEWASVDFNTAHGKFMLLVLSIIFATLVGTKRRWRLDEAVLAGFAVCCALIHIRFMYFAGIVLPPILAPQIENLCSRKPYQPAKTKKVLNGLMIGIPCMLTVLRFPSTSVIDQRVREYFPVQALEFLKARPLEGNIFNPYDWGGYIEWTAPEIKTFVDSRTDIFEYKGVLKDYLSVSRLQDSQEILDHYNIQYVLYKSDSALSYFLSHTPNWKPVYRDKVAIVFERVPDRCSVQDLR